MVAFQTCKRNTETWKATKGWGKTKPSIFWLQEMSQKVCGEKITEVKKIELSNI